MNLGLTGKKILITASSEGIGKAIAKAFLEEGACVLINGRNTDALLRTCEGLQSLFGKGRVFSFCGDMSKETSIQECRDFVKQLWGSIDVLIPNLGNGKPAADTRLDITEWHFMMEQNLYSAVSLIHAFEPMLFRGTSSSIIMLSSIAAYERSSAPYAYAASKSAIMSLVRSLAADYAVRNVRVNCVAPGNIFFPGGRWDELQSADTDSVKKYITSNVPMKRFGKPEEIAAAVAFLSSERSSFTTGAVLVVDGGQKKS